MGGSYMVIKSTPRNVSASKTTSKKSASKAQAQVGSAASSDRELRRIIEQQAKQIQNMEKMIQSLDADVQVVKKQLANAQMPSSVENVLPKTKASAKTMKKATKEAPVSVTTAPASVKKSARASLTKGKKTTGKVGKKTVLEDLVEIPQEIADRINALTAQKKVTQTQLGKETDLSQKKIHEIASRKVKDLNKEILSRLSAVIKKYEAT